MDSVAGPTDDWIARIHELTIRYGSREAVSRFSAEFSRGELTVLIGSNASGKTTLIHALAGLTSGMQCSGSIQYCGLHRGARVPVGFAVPVNALPNHVEPRVAMEIVARTLTRPRRERALKYSSLVGLEPFLAQPISQLSTGTRQKLSVALALLAPAELFLFDESMSAMDSAALQTSLAFLRHIVTSERVAALVVTHTPEVIAPYADRLIAM